MSHLLDRLNFLQKKAVGTFAGGHGETTTESRDWEEVYRNRWRHDKVVRSTHGVNCTGSCSWKIYVKSGIVTWETQQTDYPRTRPDLPNHEPRGCARGASYSWYLYSANRVKTPLIRARLLKSWRKMRETMSPTSAWAAIQADPALRGEYVKLRGKGGFVRASWDEATEIIAAANAHTAKKYGPDRVFGFSPIPAMSMVSYAAGSRYLSLLGGTCMSFYDWYCDLPPASPQTWGEQTDVPEIGGLVQFRLPDPLGLERAADPHAGRAFLHRGALSRCQIGGDLPGLFRGLEVLRHLALAEGGHRQRARDGDGPCDPARVPSRPAGGIFRGIRPHLYRHADAGEARGARRSAGAGPDAARGGFLRRARRGEQPRLEDGRLGRDVRQDRRTQRIGRVPLGSGGQVEPRGQGRRRGGCPAPEPDPRTGPRRRGRGGFPLFRRRGDRAFREMRASRRAHAPGSGAAAAAEGRRGDGRDGLRPLLRQLRPRPRARRRLGDGGLRRRRALYPGLGREDHRRQARRDHHGGARIRVQRGEDPRQVHGDPRGRAEPLVPHGHELPRHHQHAGDVRLRRPVGRWLEPLRRSGEAAAADRLDRARLRAGLEPAAAAHELDLGLVRAYRSVALRDGDVEARS